MEEKNILCEVPTDGTGGAAYLYQEVKKSNNEVTYNVMLFNKKTGYSMHVYSSKDVFHAMQKFHEFIKCVLQPV